MGTSEFRSGAPLAQVPTLNSWRPIRAKRLIRNLLGSVERRHVMLLEALGEWKGGLPAAEGITP